MTAEGSARGDGKNQHPPRLATPNKGDRFSLILTGDKRDDWGRVSLKMVVDFIEVNVWGIILLLLN